MKKPVKIALIILAAALLIIAAAVSAYFIWEKKPAVSETLPEETAAPELMSETVEVAENDSLEDLEYEAIENERKDGVYTILLVGIDDMSDQTDTILVCKLDTNEHTMNLVSIPRDTLINVPWEVKKINSVYYGAENSDKDPQKGIDALKEQVKKIIGYDVDCYAFISVKSLVDVIDAVGGVDFDVPTYIQYIDQAHDYWVFLGPGYQHLDGVSAMAVVRYRETYSTGDLGRIEVQHDFLKAAAEQFLSLGTIPHAKEIIKIIKSETHTDLSDANIAYLFRQALQCSADDIKFMTLPVTNQNLDLSYAVISLDEWVEMLNEYLNPFSEPLTYGNLDVVFKNYFGYGCTGFPQDPIFFANVNGMDSNNSHKDTDEKADSDTSEQTPELPQTSSAPEITVPETPSDPQPEVQVPDIPDIPQPPSEPAAEQQTDNTAE